MSGWSVRETFKNAEKKQQGEKEVGNKEILNLIVEAQNAEDWNGAREKLITVLSNSKTQEEFEFVVEEISSRDWFF